MRIKTIIYWWFIILLFPCPMFLFPAEWIRNVGCWCLSGYKLWCFCVTMANFISSITVDEYSIKQPSIIVQPSGTVCYLCCWLVDIKAFGIFLYFSCPSNNFFCVVMADFICCNSHWIVYQATFDHGPTIGDSLFICLLLVGWLVYGIWNFLIFQLTAWPWKIDQGSIGLSGNFDKLADGGLTIYGLC